MENNITGEYEHVYENGDLYKGEWLNGLRHGMGTFTTSQGQYLDKDVNHKKLET